MENVAIRDAEAVAGAEGQVIPDFTLVVNPGTITLDVAPGGNPKSKLIVIGRPEEIKKLNELF